MVNLLEEGKKHIVALNSNNEFFANQFLQIIRENIAKNDSIKDKAKFLQGKKKEILEILQQHDVEIMQEFNKRLAKMMMTHNRQSLEAESAQDTRAHTHKIKKNFDRDDAYSVMKSKNLGLTDA